SEHSARYDRVAGILNGEGYAIFAPDHRAHGRTAASTGVGIAGPNGVEGIVADLDQLIDIAHSDVGDLPVVLFGHSMGAVISLMHAERHGDRLVGLALSGLPGADENTREMLGALQGAIDAGMGDEPVEILGAFNGAFEPARTPFDWLSRDAAEVDRYVADPFCGASHPMTYGFLAAFITGALDASEPAGIAKLPKLLPILLLTGECDPASQMAAGVRDVEKRLRDAGLAVDAIYYPDARHEILNETNRDEVHADLVRWLRTHLGQS
ncbi:MAG TPA: alpha/beta hydrolase, partial [Acidimicrobiia bacterium]|nr:alpha/beta hydrolase [Acidimicrobiia bacterium]